MGAGKFVVLSGIREVGAPTLARLSVRLLRVVDLPEDGLPTRAMRGSRGMVMDRSEVLFHQERVFAL